MKKCADGSAVLSSEESTVVAKVLELSRDLCVQLGATDQDANPETVEYNLLAVLDMLEELGVSSDELTGKLDHRPRTN